MRYGVVCAATIALLWGCAAIPAGAAPATAVKGTGTMVTLNAQDNGGRVTARVGDVLELHLGENATTGYRWAPDSYDTGRLELVETTANYPAAALGSGGQAVFRFRVTAAGAADLTLKYWRHWEGAASIIQRFAVTIDGAP